LEIVQTFLTRVIFMELTLHARHIMVCVIKLVRTFLCYDTWAFRCKECW